MPPPRVAPPATRQGCLGGWGVGAARGMATSGGARAGSGGADPPLPSHTPSIHARTRQVVMEAKAGHVHARLLTRLQHGRLGVHQRLLAVDAHAEPLRQARGVGGGALRARARGRGRSGRAARPPHGTGRWRWCRASVPPAAPPGGVGPLKISGGGGRAAGRAATGWGRDFGGAERGCTPQTGLLGVFTPSLNDWQWEVCRQRLRCCHQCPSNWPYCTAAPRPPLAAHQQSMMAAAAPWTASRRHSRSRRTRRGSAA